MKKIFGSIATLLLLFILAGSLAAFAVYYAFAIKKQTLKEGSFLVASSTKDIAQVAAKLQEEGFIADSSDYLLFARNLKKTKVYGGHYKIEKDATFRRLFATLGGGLQSPIKVTFNNIRSLERLAAVVGAQIEADSAEIVSYFSNGENSKKFGFKPQNFLSMVIPNTYEFYWNTSAEQFAAKMAKEYKTFWNRQREEKRKALNLSREEVSILASIVVEESKIKSEMALIAGVYLNRLKRGMLLQADPTVKFALGDPSIKRILYSHLKTDSPYNTYKYRGLPPGIIYLPPISAIDGVLNYRKSPYLYFCASPELDGSHRFAKSLSEHNKNAREYAQALNRLGIRK